MLRRLSWLCQVPAVPFALLLLVAGGFFGATHGVLAFLLSIPTLGGLGLIALGAALWASFGRGKRSRAAVAMALIGLTPLLYLCSYGVLQEIRFLLWAPQRYESLKRASAKDGIITDWDSWGWGGEDTSSYLVSDRQDTLGSKSRAQQWTKTIGQSCGIWQAQRVWPRLYIVTTFTNCPYRTSSPPA